MKTIFEYPSFRSYIRDLFAQEKLTAKNVTLAQYAKKFSLSASALNLILFGKRNLTVASTNQVARSLRLSKSEREYFEALVLWEQADHDETKSYYAGRLKSMRQQKNQARRRTSDKQLLTAWQIPALLIYLIDFERIKSFDAINYERISNKFSISASETKRLIDLFKKLGLLETDPKDGAHIVFDRVSSQSHQKEFYRATQNEILKRLDQEFPQTDTFFRATVFTISKSKIQQFRKDILQTLEEYISEDDSQSEDKVLLQGTMGFFPVR